jgi:uncharacterized membrane protein YeaQ/YmgE (transglycosylase-associated protein family)
MGLITWVMSGLVLGCLKRILLPGRPGGFFATLALSVTGALVGGYIASYFELGSLTTLHPGALTLAITGSLLMIVVVVKLRI